jgi:acetyl esterase/lipase
MNKRLWYGVGVFLGLVPMAALLLCGALAAAEKPTVFDLWPGAAPGEKGDMGEEKLTPSPKDGVDRLTNVTKPTITVYRPDKEKNTGTAVVICPGGGYSILAVTHEGRQVAEWLNSIGVTGIVLKYRVPARKERPRYEAALQDAQRAMSLVRGHAQEWGIKPDRIGILGFSAGGHLAAAASTNFDKRQYQPIDDQDKIDCRPDFTVLCYPAYLTAKDGSLSPEIRVDAKTPPTFFVHAGDDRITSEGSIAVYVALKRLKIPAEMHIYAEGGHGFGMRPGSKPVAAWPQRCGEWMKSRGLLEK